MKHVRPIGNSFTVQSDSELGRGITANDENTKPDEVVELFDDYTEHKLRLVVSMLDKVVRKSRSLSHMHETAYVDRGKLGKALWAQLVRDKHIEPTEDLQKVWRAKVHPYLKYDNQYFDEPEKDKNYSKIVDLRDSALTRADFEKLWHDTFWIVEGGRPQYGKIAGAIISHVFEKERKLVRQRDEGARQPSEQTRKVGRLARSSSNIASSAHDPRKTRGSKPRHPWEDKDWDTYCRSEDIGDIAEQIFNAAVDAFMEVWLAGKDLRFSVMPREDFGRMLYEHYGRFNDLKKDVDERKRLGSLHFAVRKHYAKIAKSNRYRFCFKDLSEGDADRSIAEALFAKYLPRDGEALKHHIEGKQENAEVSQLIRLGKMVIHASDFPFRDVGGDAPQLLPEEKRQLGEQFEKRIDFFATSAGLSEIKRSEAFNRVWRNAISLSTQSFKGFLKNNAAEFDPGKTAQINKAINALDSSFSWDHAKVIFGTKKIPAKGDGTARHSVVLPDVESTPAVLEGLAFALQELRASAFHFSTMRHVLAKLESSETLQRTNIFDPLLNYDSDIIKYAWEDEIIALSARDYLSSDQLIKLAEQTARVGGARKVTTPKFNKLMKYIGHIVKADEKPDSELNKLAKHHLDADALTKEGENRTRVGLLRLVYQRGFERWLEEKLDKIDLSAAVISTVREKGLARSKAYNNDRNLVAVIPSSRVEKLKLGEAKSLVEVFERMSSEIATEERLHRQYRPNKHKQKEVSNDTEKLRLEIYAYLFAEYLKDDKVGFAGWIHDIEKLEEPTSESIAIEAQEVPVDNWASTFYAWLYTLPPEDVSQLQHQFRKTAALDRLDKAGSRSAYYLGNVEQADQVQDEFAEHRERMLNSLDALMSLYVRVQATGFDGTEAKLEGFRFEKRGEKVEIPFAENSSQLDDLFDPENSDVNIKRTRRGFRYIKRFGHLSEVGPIFAKHPVQSSEIKRASTNAEAHTFEFDRHALRLEIVNLLKLERKERQDKPKKPEFNEKTLADKCVEYRSAAVCATRNRFDVNGARLYDHFRAHEIFVRIWGRLTDFAETWERDRIYIFFGMLYQQTGGKLSFTVQNRNLCICAEGFDNLEVWTHEKGFNNELKFFEHVKSLNKANKDLYNKYFLKHFPHDPSSGPLSDCNPKDQERRRRANEAKKPTHKSDYTKGPAQIRSDLAHFNPMNKGNHRGRLSYLVNAVRSLMAYDRKLKNSVSKSIINLMAKEGMVLRWQMIEDRLKYPRIEPKLETHLGFVQGRDRDESFVLPQVSPRLSSMMQGLFWFDSDGHQPKTRAKDAEMIYPSSFKNSFHRDQTAVEWDKFGSESI